MITALWLAICGLVLVAPGRAPVPSRSGGSAAAVAASPTPATAAPRWPAGLAVAALGAAAVALAGPVSGALTAVVLCPPTWWALRRLADRPRREALAAGDPAVPLVLDLAAAALRAGRPPAAALAAAAPVAPAAVRDAFLRVAGLLRLGAEPSQAWSVLARDGPLGPVAVVAVRSATSGAKLASAFERLAGELRAEAAGTAAVRAARTGVLAMAPLGLCFLPSFVLLGVVPVIVGMARTALGAGF